MDRQCLVMGWSKSLWEHRAFAMNGQQVLSSLKLCYLLSGHHAMVGAISPAASGQPGFGVSSPRKRRPDELKAEEQQQRDGKETAHAFSINQTVTQEAATTINTLMQELKQQTISITPSLEPRICGEILPLISQNAVSANQCRVEVVSGKVNCPPRTLKIYDLADNFLDNNEMIRLPMLTVYFSSRWRFGLQ